MKVSRWAHWWYAPMALVWLLRVARRMRRHRGHWQMLTATNAASSWRNQLGRKERHRWEMRWRALQAVARRIPGFACLVRATALAGWMQSYGLAAEVVMALWRKPGAQALGHAFVRLGNQIFDEAGINHADLQEVAFADIERPAAKP